MTWPQLFLILDGAEYNAPVLDEDNGKPLEPDKETEPVAYLRWQLIYQFKRPSEDVEALCQRFEADIASGARVWDGMKQDWVPAQKESSQ